VRAPQTPQQPPQSSARHMPKGAKPRASLAAGRSPGRKQDWKHPGIVVGAARASNTSKEKNPNTHHPPRMPHDPELGLTVRTREGQGPSSSPLLRISLQAQPDLLHASHNLLHRPCSSKRHLQPSPGWEPSCKGAGRGAAQVPQGSTTLSRSLQPA